ncbi:MAG: hypothetical protein ACRDID_02490, partial [Ktedonobacterales bacterium]
MAKKNSTHKQRQAQAIRNGAANRAQASGATLVRPASLDMADGEAVTPASSNSPVSTPAAASIVRDTPAKPVAKPAPKPVTAPRLATPLKATAPLTAPAKP